MGLLGAFKGEDKGLVPPDVGTTNQSSDSSSGIEPAYDPGESEPISEEEDEDKGSKGKKGKKEKTSYSGKKDDAMLKLNTERIDARLESINELVKALSERFSAVNQQIGEIRSMSLSNEKAISKVDAASLKAVEIVSAVKPEQIRFDYEKVNQKVELLAGKINSNKEYLDAVIEQLKDLKRKSEAFVGVEGLIRLQGDVKKDLLNIEQVAAKAQMHADKAEQLFIEIERVSHENNQIIETLANFDRNYSSLKKEFEKMKIDFSNIATMKDISELKKRIESKIAQAENAVSYTEHIKEDNEKLLRLLENTVSLSKKNEQDIKNIGISIGSDKLGGVVDYAERLNSLLSLVDTLAKQMSSVRKKLGMISGKINKEAVSMNVQTPIRAPVQALEKPASAPVINNPFRINPPDMTDESDKIKIDESEIKEEDAETNELKVMKDKETVAQLQNLISESFDIIDSADINEVQEKYDSMRKLYGSLSVENNDIRENIMNFYNAVYNKFYAK